MDPSSAKKTTKRARKVLKELLFIKDNYVNYIIGHDDTEWRKAVEKFTTIEDYIVELSAGKRVMEAELAEKIKKEDY